MMPFIGCNQESLIFVDKKRQIEVFANHLSEDTSYSFAEIKNKKELEEFCKEKLANKQAYIIKLDKDSNEEENIYKSLYTKKEIISAYKKLEEKFKTKSLWIESDNRADRNPKRQGVIKQTGEILLKKLLSLCPKCQSPGFSLSHYNEGLPCEICLAPSKVAKEEVFSCASPNCNYKKSFERSDGKKKLESRYCNYCNP